MRTNKRRFRNFVLIPGGLLAIGALLLVVSGFEGAHFENSDTSCAACHSQPESAFVARSLAPHPVDLASFHTAKGTRCIDCHSGPGLTGRISALALGAKDATAYLLGHYAQPAPLTRPIGDVQCTKCHSDIAASQSFNNHFHVFLPQWQGLSTKAASCVSCHEGHTTDGAVEIGYLNEPRTTQVCQACHSFAGEGV